MNLRHFFRFGKPYWLIYGSFLPWEYSSFIQDASWCIWDSSSLFWTIPEKFKTLPVMLETLFTYLRAFLTFLNPFLTCFGASKIICDSSWHIRNLFWLASDPSQLTWNLSDKFESLMKVFKSLSLCPTLLFTYLMLWLLRDPFRPVWEDS